MQGWDWDSSSSSGNKSGNKAEFTKFPEGVTRIRILDDIPNIRWTHWMPQFGRSVTCPGIECPIDEIRKNQKANKEPVTYQASRRFAINIINRETGRAEVLDQGVGFFNDLRELGVQLQEDYYDELKTNPDAVLLKLKDIDIKVRRRDSADGKTTWRLDIDKAYPLSKEDLELAKEKIDLDEYFKPHTPDQILQLLEVSTDHKKAWIRIMSGEEESEEKVKEEDEEIELG